MTFILDFGIYLGLWLGRNVGIVRNRLGEMLFGNMVDLCVFLSVWRNGSWYKK
jgi:hypothetical protein